MNESPSNGSDGVPLTEGRGVRLPIWLKILAALVVPLIVVAALALLQVREARQRVAEVDEETGLASVAVSPGGLVDALIIERGDALVSMIGVRESATFPTENIDESIANSDVAVEALQTAVNENGEAAQEAFADTLRLLEFDLPTIRETVQAGVASPGLFEQWSPSSAVYDKYSDLIESLTNSNRALISDITDPELRRAGETLDDVNRAHDAISNLSLYIARDILSPEGGDESRADVVISVNDYTEARESLMARTDGPWGDAVRAYQQNFTYEDMQLRAEEYLSSGDINIGEFIGLNPQVSIGEEPAQGTTQRVALDATNALEGQIDTLRSDARSEERNYTILAIAVVLGAAVLAALAARSVTRPLRQLTAQAREMASERLPRAVSQVLDTPPGEDVVVPDLPPLEVKSRDEVQEVAAALNQVQASALDLAVEQATLRRNIAESFVSLGRRTQNLIGLQLEQITRLEEDEADPNVLESLYRLDHLATRARRNAESLVVLGGLETQRSGGRPIRMTDVVRATLSEVQDYQRVELVRIDEALVPSTFAADLIHLLAELTENGLIFSPPSSVVDIHGVDDSGNYRLTIEDRGVGMTDEKLEEANIRLAGNENFTVAPSRYLGHYVAGRLAARIGASVTLSRAEGGGTLATVVVPSSLLLEALDDTMPEPSSSAPAATVSSLGEAPSAEEAEPTPARPMPTDPSHLPAEPAAAGAGLDGFKTDGRPPVAPSAPAGAPVTSTGLRRRVPGQHSRPGQIAGPMIPRNDPAAAPPTAPPVPRPAAFDSPPAPDADTPTSPNLATLLTAYNSGVERGRQDADGAEDPDSAGDSAEQGDPSDQSGPSDAGVEGVGHENNGSADHSNSSEHSDADSDSDSDSDDAGAGVEAIDGELEGELDGDGDPVGEHVPRRDALDREHAP